MRKLAATATPINRLILVSPPWPVFNRPSIQLSALKAFIADRIPDIDTVASHFYLEVAKSLGYSLYSAVSEKTWPAESVYAALLYPDRISRIESVFHKDAGRNQGLRAIDFKALTKRVKQITDAYIESIDWDRFGLAGFSVCLCQLTSTLYLVRAVREQAPGLPIVLGGSSLAGKTGTDLLRAFPEIDFVVNGEGEVPLVRLITSLKNHSGLSSEEAIPGITTRSDVDDGNLPRCIQVTSMDDLPYPDYGDYFEQLNRLPDGLTFFPTLPVEISRGCFWQRPAAGTTEKGCSFCNLNMQWAGYRAKTADRIAREIDATTSRYRALSVAFTDNLLPVHGGREIFTRIGSLKKDLRMFGEIRAATPSSMLAAMASAGVSEVQIGIEALSNSLLRKLNKGTTAIQNIEIMKRCEEMRVASRSNLILYFPGSQPEEVEETLRALSFVLPFRPLKPVRFWLGLGSPVWSTPEKFGIRAVFNHPHYHRLFPPEVSRLVQFTIQAYRGDLTQQRKLWKPVADKLKEWNASYARLHAHPDSEPILAYRDGGDFIIIRHRRMGADPDTHRLTGMSRSIYLFCRRNRSLREIIDRFPKPGAENIRAFLNMMVRKKLMFEASKRYLSLAVRIKPF